MQGPLAVATVAAVLATASVVHAEGPLDFIDDDEEIRTVPIVRVAMGPSVALEPDVHPEFALDVTGGFASLQGISGGVAYGAEVGYAFESGDARGTVNAASLGVGIGYGLIGSALAYQPRAIVGVYDGDLAIGMRNGLGLHLVGDIASIELAHQFESVASASAGDDRTLRQDVRLMLGVNPAAIIYLFP